VHCFISSRYQLPFSVSGLQAKGQMQRLDVQDLRFRLWLDEAEYAALQALMRPDTQPYARIQAHGAIRLAWVQWARGQGELASETLERVQAKIDSPDREAFIRKIKAQQTYMSLMRGLPQGTGARMDRCKRPKAIRRNPVIPLG
jgi:hypothetical protein